MSASLKFLTPRHLYYPHSHNAAARLPVSSGFALKVSNTNKEPF